MSNFSKPKPVEVLNDTEKFLKLFDRRSFMKYSGIAAASTAFMLVGCDNDNPIPLEKIRNNPGKGQGLSLGKGDVGVLNYAYALEQLEASFYIMATINRAFMSIFNAEEKQILEDLRNHEIVHRDFLKAVLGNNAIPILEFDFDSINFESRESVLGAAKTFEDLGVAAYNGAGQMLENPDFLVIAGKIVSVEARHASAIRDVLDSDPTSFAGDDIIDSNGLDLALPPAVVLRAAEPFIKTKLNASLLQKR